MKRITIEGPLASRLPAAGGAVELVDANGYVLGVFTPDPVYLDSEPPLTEAERAQDFSNVRLHTTAEVLAYLERL